MVRTQIYLDERQKSALEKLCVERGASVSDLIRQAVDLFIAKASTDFDEALDLSFGIWRSRRKLGESSEYVRKIRSEWDGRDRRG
jgi:Arc/MetJ-type ribon-helix-helix transcriptional regulator